MSGTVLAICGIYLFIGCLNAAVLGPDEPTWWEAVLYTTLWPFSFFRK